MKLTTQPHLVLRLRMHGAIPPLTQYVFLTWCLIKQWIHLHRVGTLLSTGTTLPLPYLTFGKSVPLLQSEIH